MRPARGRIPLTQGQAGAPRLREVSPPAFSWATTAAAACVREDAEVRRGSCRRRLGDRPL